MITFFKSIFRGMGYTIGKLIIFFLLGCLGFLFLNNKVSAATFEVGGIELRYFSTNNWWLNYSNATTFNAYTTLWHSEYGAYYTSQSIATGTYGGGFAGTVDFIPGNYYVITYATSKPVGSNCAAPNNWNTQFKAATAINSNATNRATIIRSFVSSGTVTFTPQDEWLDACVYSVTFTVSQVVNTVTLPFNSSTSTSGSWVFFGFNLENLGESDKLTPNDINNAVNNINSKIESSMNSLGSSINNNLNDKTQDIINNQNSNQQQTNQKLDDVKEEQKKTNGFLSSLLNLFKDNGGDTNASSLGNVAGWLPPGPIDSILNLPLSFLNAINNVFNSSTCVPISLTLPFVNSVVQLPCWSSIVDTLGIRVFWESMGTLVGGIMAYYYLLNLYTRLHMALTLKEMGKPWGAV